MPGHGDVMDKDTVATQVEELATVAAICADGLATGLFDARHGPYPEATMQTAWERAKLEVGVR